MQVRCGNSLNINRLVILRYSESRLKIFIDLSRTIVNIRVFGQPKKQCPDISTTGVTCKRLQIHIWSELDITKIALRANPTFECTNRPFFVGLYKTIEPTPRPIKIGSQRTNRCLI